MKTALVYDWLVTVAGGERALKALYELYPAPIFTLVEDRKALEGTFFAGKEVHSSFLQRVPFARRHFRNYLPLFPLAIEGFDLGEYDLVISSSHAVAKGVLTHPRQLHLCYCYTPMRYAWDLTHQYLQATRRWKRGAVKMALHYLRNWDISSVCRVDHFAAISHYVARRIEKYYGRTATVIYPPVEVERFSLAKQKEEYYLTASRLVPYKRIDLIVEAFAQMPEKKLLVIGTGPEEARIKAKAKKNVEFLGYVSDAQMAEYMAKAKAFVFAAEEDFGIVVVEALAAGTPVIAYGRGGALEIVKEKETGIFFREPTVGSVVEAVAEFERGCFVPEVLQRDAQRFCVRRFQREFQQFVEAAHESRHSRRR